jgi:biopolymer transport protein ExbD
MGEQPIPQFFDVWIVQGNTVYQDVPYSVVADWVQQSRLLDGDRLRAKGGTAWVKLTESPEFAPYRMAPEPLRIHDQTEALAPVEFEMEWKAKSHGQEDDDVDMIPLIDISLVLLIFFMMTSTVAGAGGKIDVPITQYTTDLAGSEVLWIGVDFVADTQPPRYSIREGERGASSDDSDLSQAKVLERLKEVLAGGPPREVRIAAHKKLSSDVVFQLLAELARVKIVTKKITSITTEVGGGSTQ